MKGKFVFFAVSSIDLATIDWDKLELAEAERRHGSRQSDSN